MHVEGLLSHFPNGMDSVAAFSIGADHALEFLGEASLGQSPL